MDKLQLSDILNAINEEEKEVESPEDQGRPALLSQIQQVKKEGGFKIKENMNASEKLASNNLEKLEPMKTPELLVLPSLDEKVIQEKAIPDENQPIVQAALNNISHEEKAENKDSSSASGNYTVVSGKLAISGDINKENRVSIHTQIQPKEDVLPEKEASPSPSDADEKQAEGLSWEDDLLGNAQKLANKAKLMRTPFLLKGAESESTENLENREDLRDIKIVGKVEDLIDARNSENRESLRDTETAEKAEDLIDIESSENREDLRETEIAEKAEDPIDIENSENREDLRETEIAEKAEDPIDIENSENKEDLREIEITEKAEDPIDIENFENREDLRETEIAEKAEGPIDAGNSKNIAGFKDIESADEAENPLILKTVNGAIIKRFANEMEKEVYETVHRWFDSSDRDVIEEYIYSALRVWR